MRAAAIALLVLTLPATASAQPLSFSNSWDSDQFTEFRHVITGPPGRVALQLDATTTSGGGETVAVYPVTASGARGKVRVMFVIATTRGNSRTGSITLGPPRRGEATSSTELMVIVENNSGRRQQGEYTLTATPGG